MLKDILRWFKKSHDAGDMEHHGKKRKKNPIPISKGDLILTLPALLGLRHCV